MPRTGSICTIVVGLSLVASYLQLALWGEEKEREEEISLKKKYTKNERERINEITTRSRCVRNDNKIGKDGNSGEIDGGKDERERVERN